MQSAIVDFALCTGQRSQDMDRLIYFRCKNVIKVHPDITEGMLTVFRILTFFSKIIVQNVKVIWVNLHIQRWMIVSLF